MHSPLKAGLLGTVEPDAHSHISLLTGPHTFVTVTVAFLQGASLDVHIVSKGLTQLGHAGLSSIKLMSGQMPAMGTSFQVCW